MLKFRYTRSLEQQVEFLKGELVKRDQQIQSLTKSLERATSQAAPMTAAEMTRLSVQRHGGSGKKSPQPLNFLQARGVLEQASAAGIEIKVETEEEKQERLRQEA